MLGCFCISIKGGGNISEKKVQLLKGLFIGIGFGFLLQRAGVTRYNVIIGQLMLDDFTVLKVIVTAIIVGMIGIYYLDGAKKIELKPKSSSLMEVIPGGLIFGVGFALLGYCPGTIAGAVGQGNLDALIAGFIGIVGGTGLFAFSYEKLKPILEKGELKPPTLPEYFEVNRWLVIIPVSVLLILGLVMLEAAGY